MKDACVKRFKDQLGHDKIYVTTERVKERVKELSHVIGQGLFEGKTPISKRLSEVEIKKIPNYFLNKGIDENEWVNFGENIDIILLRINKVGLKKFCKILFEIGIEMI